MDFPVIIDNKHSVFSPGFLRHVFNVFNSFSVRNIIEFGMLLSNIDERSIYTVDSI